MSMSEKAPQLHEIRFHGRGGQGAVSAAALLSLAAFGDGFEAQAFPKFGSERRGAPVEAYVRISDRPIRSHTQVYAPDAVIVQDRTLLRSEPVTAGLAAQGLVILNAEQCPDDANTADWRWLCLPADRISEALLGRPLPNTVLLGALAAATGWVSLAALEQAIGSHLQRKGEKIVEANIAALREGYRGAQQQLQSRESVS
jgi:pyruvate ferredoxin oxidoreductase gamma subunit